MFWMSFKDFMTYFNLIDICKTDPHLLECRLKGIFASTSVNEARVQVYHLTVYNTSVFDLSLFHIVSRNRLEKSGLDMCFMVFRADADNANSIGDFVTTSKRLIFTCGSEYKIQLVFL